MKWHKVAIGRGIGSPGVFILGWTINLLDDLEQVTLTLTFQGICTPELDLYVGQLLFPVT